MTAIRRQPRAVLYLGFGLALTLLALAGVVSWRSQSLYQSSVEWTSHSYEVLDASARIRITIQRAEASARGYALSGLHGLKTDAERRLREVDPAVLALREMVADNPLQTAHVDSLATVLEIRKGLIRELIDQRDATANPDHSMAGVVTRGDAANVAVRAMMSRLDETERTLLVERSVAAADRGRVAIWTVASAIALALLILAAATAVTMQELNERTHAEQALQLEAERQAVIIEVQQAIATAAAGDQAVLELVVEQAMQLTGAAGAALTMVDGEYHTAHVARGDLIPWIGVRNPLANSLAGDVLRKKEPEIIPDVMTDPRTDKAIAGKLETRSTAILPVISGDHAIGALIISSKTPNAFTAEDFAALRVMSGIVSAGLTNAAAFAANERLLGELRASRDAAEAANRAKSSFLATMSHELRTPLNSVIGFANILLRNKEKHFGEKDLQFLTRIKDNGTHLLHLINDVLDVSKIEAGRMEVRPVPVELAPLITETLAQLDAQVRDRPVVLRAQIPPVLHPTVMDPARLKQVLMNLIGNALKFTEAGSVTVSVRADHEGRPVRIDVTDTGIGIPADRLHAIFEAFTQAEVTTERRFGGTGLGLTISRALLQLMGAELTVTSEVGRGSTFSIGLPISPVPAVVEEARPATTGHTPPPIPAAGPAPLILVVDDEADSRTLLRNYLEEDGFRTAEASDGAEGLALVRELKPALVTLDLRMPGMSGTEFLRQIRQDPELADTPVVVVSIEAAEKRGSLIGAVDVLSKPVERDALLAVIQRVRPTGRRRVLIVDDDAHTRQLFATILGAEGYQVRTAEDGLEALTALQTEMPDLILLDLMMPVMDGGTFLAALRSDPRFSGVPVAVITALDSDSDMVRRLDGVAQAVLQKGTALEQTIHQLIDRLIGPAKG